VRIGEYVSLRDLNQQCCVADIRDAHAGPLSLS
jgi:hypothetical protein